MIDATKFTPEELAEWHVKATERRMAWQRGGMGDVFTPVDLGHWIALCRYAGVPMLPAQLVGNVGVEDLLMSTEREYMPTPEAKLFWDRLESVKVAYKKGWMLRWACCAMADLKHEINSGRPDWQPSMMQLFVEDVRAFDLIYKFPAPQIGAYLRPWFELAKVDGFPVEYRAFVKDDQILGVSNYYPQRPMQWTEETHYDASQVIHFTQMLIKAQNKPMNPPGCEPYCDMTLNNWTADFVRLPSGAIVLLEGGPPHLPNGGGHHCCFAPGEIEGVVLEQMQPMKKD